MRNIRNPQQNHLFDEFDPVLTDRARRKLLNDWQGAFRVVTLPRLPVEALAQHFSPDIGAPTKELYSMCGLLLIKEINDWTNSQAINAYCFHMDVQFALNLSPIAHDLSVRTLERYEKLFVEDDLAAEIMERMTKDLIEICEVKTSQQRVDSTHIFSDMASLSRTRMMGVTVKRFLTQLIRHDNDAYETLDPSLRDRYAPSNGKLFADHRKDEEKRKLARQQVAEDMYTLIQRFASDPAHANRSTFRLLEKVFHEQCEVEEEIVTIRAKTSGRVIQNTSDPDATYDGHKGKGYKAQISETCHPDNEVELVTCALPQTAVDSDAHSLSLVLDDLQAKECLPDSLLADAGYGSDENACEAEARGVELVAPTQKGATTLAESSSTDEAVSDVEELAIDDFSIDEDTEIVECCPAGHKPESCVRKQGTEKTVTLFKPEPCESCDFLSVCPVKKTASGYRLEHTAKQRRLSARRKEEVTEVFRERYSLRAGIEGTNSGLKRRVGLNRLRVRGKARVFSKIIRKVTGWNILRASSCSKMRAYVQKEAKRMGFGSHSSLFWFIVGYLWASDHRQRSLGGIESWEWLNLAGRNRILTAA